VARLATRPPPHAVGGGGGVAKRRRRGDDAGGYGQDRDDGHDRGAAPAGNGACLVVHRIAGRGGEAWVPDTHRRAPLVGAFPDDAAVREAAEGAARRRRRSRSRRPPIGARVAACPTMPDVPGFLRSSIRGSTAGSLATSVGAASDCPGPARRHPGAREHRRLGGHIRGAGISTVPARGGGVPPPSASLRSAPPPHCVGLEDGRRRWRRAILHPTKWGRRWRREATTEGGQRRWWMRRRPIRGSPAGSLAPSVVPDRPGSIPARGSIAVCVAKRRRRGGMTLEDTAKTVTTANTWSGAGGRPLEPRPAPDRGEGRRGMGPGYAPSRSARRRVPG
jgi:hypothetical protein